MNQETPRARFDRWRTHFQESLQGYRKLDTGLAMDVLRDTADLWERNAQLESTLSCTVAREERIAQDASDTALREVLGMIDLAVDAAEGDVVQECLSGLRQQVIGQLAAKPAPAPVLPDFKPVDCGFGNPS